MAMTFWDEVDWTEVDQIETRSLVLVDHNKMTDQLAAHFKPHQVRQVLDHHAGWQRIDRERCHLSLLKNPRVLGFCGVNVSESSQTYS